MVDCPIVPIYFHINLQYNSILLASSAEQTHTSKKPKYLSELISTFSLFILDLQSRLLTLGKA